ncbi:MAG: zf-HC2 domain-containing protein [Clostridia bacterium]|nr:zf-HC2 domain-containing protein [Clostridia bacterium]
MNCNVIKDLIPLYIDDCCSQESGNEVKKHLESCCDCKAVFESMNCTVESKETSCAPKKLNKVNDWKASILQSVLFFLSFLLITTGVYFEAGTNYHDFGNGLAAFNVVVPATGFLLSLTNWYFVKLYPSRKVFSWCSCVLSVAVTLGATVWCLFHYEMNITDFWDNITFIVFFKSVIFLFGIETMLTVIFAVAAKTLSNYYAKMLGKE